MPSFIGGSAPAMASQICEGYFLLNKNTLRGFSPGELGLLKQELEKIQRDLRGLVPPQDDALAQQARNRKIGRISSALQIVGGQLTGRR
jgi:hypothetical protein